MFKHNFKVIYRQMLKDKAYSVINIGGLAIGMVVAMLIGLWVHDELTYNHYHKDYDRIVQIMNHHKFRDRLRTSTYLTTGASVVIKESFPDRIEDIFMIRAATQEHVLIYKDNKFRQEGIFMGPAGPKVLGFEMIAGTLDGLNDRRSIMLNESFAKSLFGNENPINKSLMMNDQTSLLVTGVYKDIPENSKFNHANYVMNLELLLTPERMNIWDDINVDIYAKVAPGVNTEELGNLMTEAVEPFLPNFLKEREMQLFLHPMKDWHLKSEFRDFKQVTSQRMQFVWLYSILGVFVLILACINFTNLSTARSEKRAKESGIRKTLGSHRKQLIAQFYIESLLYSAMAFGPALVLLAALIPWFNETSGKGVAAPWDMAGFWLISLSFVLLTGILAGAYPAMYLSSFEPVKALKGKFSSGKRASLPRKILVVVQFTISIGLIIGTITVSNQIKTAKDRPPGYSPEGLIAIKQTSREFLNKSIALKQELLNSGYAMAAGSSNYSIINNRGSNSGFSLEGMDEGFDIQFNTINVTTGYAEAVGMDFITGRDFSEAFQTDKNAIIINRKAMELMNLENPLGTIVNYAPGWKAPKNYTIIGVVEDMVKKSPFARTDPSIIFLSERAASYMYIRVNPTIGISESINGLREAFARVLPNDPFDFSFAENDYNKKFIEEQRISNQASFFSIVAIVISCLGLFGLASFMAEHRIKEVGIRKVLGASVGNVMILLSKDFAVLVLFASLISIPIAYRVLDHWLDSYEIRTQLYWWIFAIAGIGTLMITLLTVSIQALKAAMSNPVKALSTE
ncbi:MAG: FtsX-like permease family protein [Roseivirga sp.]|nr:FtsX-like permease family protein [Roseivirga sp.]